MPPEVDPVSAARVCAAIFQGLVLQQAWDPGLDIDGYIDAVIALIGRFTGAHSAASGGAGSEGANGGRAGSAVTGGSGAAGA